MVQQQIKNALTSHGVPIQMQGEVLMAGNEYTIAGQYFCEWVSTARWILKDLRSFLNY